MTPQQEQTIAGLRRYRFSTAPLSELAHEVEHGNVRIVVPMFQYAPRVIVITPNGGIVEDR